MEIAKIDKKESDLIYIQPKKIIRRNQIPDHILNNPMLNEAMKKLPNNYKFEIIKCVHRIIVEKSLILPKLTNESRRMSIGLQFPEGLLMFSHLISDIFSHFCDIEVIILGDISYGACCINDFEAKSLGIDFLIHYGHSCVVPIPDMVVKPMYVFVEIGIDINHLIQTILFNFHQDQAKTEQKGKIFLLGTVQFNQAIFKASKALQNEGLDVIIPQTRPRSKGEVLGCTSPKLTIELYDSLVFISDGRFHIESTMIMNPNLKYYLYNPYSKVLTIEEYDFDKMMDIRKTQFLLAKKAKHFGLILGILGRQGQTHLLYKFQKMLEEKGKKYTIFLISEIFGGTLDEFEEIDCWVQISCPRLSIDWGHYFSKPLLNSYEAYLLLFEGKWVDDNYPMLHYSYDGGPWTSYAN